MSFLQHCDFAIGADVRGQGQRGNVHCVLRSPPLPCPGVNCVDVGGGLLPSRCLDQRLRQGGQPLLLKAVRVCLG